MSNQIKLIDLWDAVKDGGNASLQMLAVAIEAYDDHDGAIDVASQVMEMTVERPIYHAAFVSLLVSVMPIDKDGKRVKLQKKGKAKRKVALSALKDRMLDGDDASVIELSKAPKSEDDTPRKTASASARICNAIVKVCKEEVEINDDDFKLLMEARDALESLIAQRLGVTNVKKIEEPEIIDESEEVPVAITIIEYLMESFDLEEEVAEALRYRGFGTKLDIAGSSVEELTSVDGIDSEMAIELMARAA